MNLLPQTEKDILRKGFKARSYIVLSNILSVSVFIGLVMLSPAYFFADSHLESIALNASAKGEDQDAVKTALQIPDEINSKLAFMESYVKNPSMADYISSVTSYFTDKIHVNSISIGRKSKKGITIVVSGIASDREALVSFASDLKSSNKFGSVDVPVSSLTRDKDLPFSITIFIENELDS